MGVKIGEVANKLVKKHKEYRIVELSHSKASITDEKENFWIELETRWEGRGEGIFVSISTKGKIPNDEELWDFEVKRSFYDYEVRELNEDILLDLIENALSILKGVKVVSEV